MHDKLPLKIIGHGHYLPERIVPNSEVEQLCGLRNGWIAQKTGVLERRWANGETAPYMGAQAAKEALDDAGIDARKLDLIINASGTPPQLIPDGAHLLQRELGLDDSGIACMTVHTTCLSFLSGLDVAAHFLLSGRYNTILIVSADLASKGLNFKQPESASLFGDAAGAVVVTASSPEDSSSISRVHFESYSKGADYTRVRGCGTTKPPFDPATTDEENRFYMEGPKVYKMARQIAKPFLEELRPGLSKDPGGIKHVVPHQASILAVRGLRRYGFPDEMVTVNLDKYGNCVAASIPLALYEAARARRFERGDEILLVGTGAGLCIGGIIMTY